MKILLVNPPSGDVFHFLDISLPPLGLMSLAAYVRQFGYDVKIEDFQLDRRAAQRFDFAPFDLVGIGSDTTRFPGAHAIAKRAKQAGAFVVLGGPHPGYVADETLATGDVDAVVAGEGEVTFLELVRALERNDSIEGIPGVIVRRNGQLVAGPPRSAVESLDTLPLPARDLLPLERYRSARVGDRPSISIATSRGCTHDCHFCASTRFWGSRLRFRSIESVIAEIDEIYNRYGFRAIAFVDNHLTAHPGRVKAICDEILRRKWDLWWWCFGRADAIVRNPEMVEHMARAGCRSVLVGIESANRESLDVDYGKRSDPANAELAVALLKKNNIQIFASYILGGLSENHASTEATIELARRLDTQVAQFSMLTPLPGTRLFEDMKSRLRHRDWRRYDMLHVVFRHPKISTFRLYGFLLKANIRFYTRSRESRQGFMKVMRRQGVSWRRIGRFVRRWVEGR